GVNVRRHQAEFAALCQLAFEVLADPRILVRVFDLTAVVRGSRKLGQMPELEIAGLLVAQVEMLVEPAAGWREHGRLSPVADHPFAAGLPEHGVAFPGRDDDHPAWAVEVRLLVHGRVEYGHARGHARAREQDLDGVAARAARAVRGKVVPDTHIWEEVAD